jgi:hypothetical protein
VRIHADARAAESSQSVNAAAYAVGSNIVFASGRYSPGTQAGRHLLAHELTHVVQQTPVLSRQPAAPQAQSGGEQGTPSARLTDLAGVIESYAQRADAKLAAAGGGADVDAVRRNIGSARNTASGLRQIAAKGDDHVSAAALAQFSQQKMKAAASGLQRADVQGPAVAVAQNTPPSLQTKSLDISHPQDAAEMEAEHVAAAVMSGGTAAPALMRAELGIYRLDVSGAAPQLPDPVSPLPEEVEGALETELEVSRITTIVRVGAAAGGAEEMGFCLVLSPAGCLIAAAVVIVALLAVAGYWYLTKKEEAKKNPQPQPQPQPAPAPAPGPGPAPDPTKEPVPEECQETAKRISTDKCRMTATTAHSGGDPVADLFCEQVTKDPCEYRTYTDSGVAYFDAVRGNDVFECKCGYRSSVESAQRGEFRGKQRMDKLIEQIRRHLRVVKDCGLQYRLIVSNDVVADYLRGELGNEVDVGVEPSEFCD